MSIAFGENGLTSPFYPTRTIQFLGLQHAGTLHPVRSTQSIPSGPFPIETSTQTMSDLHQTELLTIHLVENTVDSEPKDEAHLSGPEFVEKLLERQEDVLEDLVQLHQKILSVIEEVNTARSQEAESDLDESTQAA